MSGNKKSFSVTGMTCITCANTVENSLKKIEEVKFASINLATKSAFLISEKDISLEKIKKAVEAVGYGISTEPAEDLEKKRYNLARKNLIFSWVITFPLSVLMIFNMIGYTVPYFVLIELIFGGIVIFYSGRETIKGAWIALAHFHTNMDTLIFIGSLACWITALLNLLGLSIISFGTIGTMIVTIHLTGRFIESHLRDKAAKEIKALIKLQAKEARVVFSDGEFTIPIEAVKVGFLVLVKPGERIPVDGKVEEGVSSVDESMISGESLPVSKNKGSKVTGGSLNLTGTFKVRVGKVGEESFLSQMIDLIKEAQGTKIPIQALADRITLWFVPTIITLALVSGIIWYFQFNEFQGFLSYMRGLFPWILNTDSSVSFAVFAFISIIVIACPCALGLAIPMALVSGTGLAAKKGMIIRNAEAIQTSKDIKIVMMDKTGTITQGNPHIFSHSLSKEEMKIVAGIESNSNHPLAKAISSFQKSNIKPEKIEEISGEGVKAVVKGDEYFIGKPKSTEKYLNLLKKGKIVVEVYKNNLNIGSISIEDPIREDSDKAVLKLKNLGIVPIMLSGDNPKTAQAIARQVGIKKVYAGVKPQDKLNIIRKYQQKGSKILMVGDGINDAASLKGADIGVAIGGGADLAIDSADIVIVKGGISRIVDSIEISRKTFQIIKQNLFWAFFYNGAVIPMAMAGLLHPAIAEGAMAISSITVILNSLRIK
ncbi:MAG: cation-translocating P-type ATPase [Candidatus Caldatribacteriota bacterium]|nr:cation-translocating P-type ATPase [Candidatus Caldatribacteriota bacterium]